MSPAPATRPLSDQQTHAWALQLHVMLAAGVSLVEALSSIARSDLPVVAETSRLLAAKIRIGQSLSQAMRSLGPTFSPFVVNLVVVGEESGSLIPVLERIAQRSLRRARTRQQVVSALTYPVVLALVSIAMSLGMAVFMFPRLLPFLVELGVPLPWPTRALVWLTDHVSWLLLAFTVLGAYASRMLATGSSPRVVRLRSWLVYRSPILGPLNADRVYADTLDDLALLVEARCDLVKGLRTLQVDWPEFADRIGACSDQVCAGVAFSEAARRSGLFPQRFAAQVKSGEETGKLSRMFKLLSDHLHESTCLRAQHLIACLEPAIMLGMGLVTGAVVLAIFLPLYGMLNTGL